MPPVAGQRHVRHTCRKGARSDAAHCVRRTRDLYTGRPRDGRRRFPNDISPDPTPYQYEAVAALLAAAARGVQRPLLVLPTGTGKTIIFALLVQRRGGRALILAHRDELIQQAVDKLIFLV